MTSPLLVFRIGYMAAYQGFGQISGGGSYIDEHGEGGEMWNFLADGGYCYGYVMSRHFGGVNLRRIAPKQAWKRGDELRGVDIVFIAPRPSVGQVVVGWYKNATVFHKSYAKRRGPRKTGDWAKLDYICVVEAENAHLLAESERTFSVPRSPRDGKGFTGTSNVWYAEPKNAAVTKYIRRLRDYIGSDQAAPDGPVGSKGRKGTGWADAPDKDLMIEVEKAAVAAVTKHFKGYKVESFEKDNRGWDLEATKGDSTLYLEVKGHLGSVIQFELTSNEYSQMQEHHLTYRVCVVREALQKAEVEVYIPRRQADGCWRLEDETRSTMIDLRERIAARAVETRL